MRKVLKPQTAELWIKNFLPLLVTIIRMKKYPAMTEDKEYYVINFKARGTGKGRGGRNLVPNELMNIRRKFLIASRQYPNIAEKFGIKVQEQSKRIRIVYVKKSLVDNFPKI